MKKLLIPILFFLPLIGMGQTFDTTTVKWQPLRVYKGIPTPYDKVIYDSTGIRLEQIYSPLVTDKGGGGDITVKSYGIDITPDGLISLAKDSTDFSKVDTLTEFVIMADSNGYLYKRKVLHIVLKSKNPFPFDNVIGDWYLEFYTKQPLKKEDLIVMFTLQ